MFIERRGSFAEEPGRPRAKRGLEHRGVVAELRVRLQDRRPELRREDLENRMLMFRLPSLLRRVTRRWEAAKWILARLDDAGLCGRRRDLSWRSMRPSRHRLGARPATGT